MWTSRCCCGWPTNNLASMISVTLFLVFIAGLWINKPAKLKSMRTGRCACNTLCFENHMECHWNSEVWNSILILSCLSALLPLTEGQAGHPEQGLEDLLTILENHKKLFTSSTAHLYTPKIDDIHNCTFRFFDCFLLEMKVVLYEEGSGEDSPGVVMVERTLQHYSQNNCSARHPCELQELTNSTLFFVRMRNFLQKLIDNCGKESNATCDWNHNFTDNINNKLT